MNPQARQEAQSLTSALIKGLKEDLPDKKSSLKIVIMPPFIWMEAIRQLQQANPDFFALGGQNIFWKDKGAYTGEISPLMLKDLGCKYALIGHSERKLYLKETPVMANKKIKAALSAGLQPVLCLSPSPQTLQTFRQEFQTIIKGLPEQSLRKIIFVYEPTEAISTQKGNIPAAETILQMKSLIESLSSSKAQILYGGSVSAENINFFAKKMLFQGVLIGANSLSAQNFLAIIRNLSL